MYYLDYPDLPADQEPALPAFAIDTPISEVALAFTARRSPDPESFIPRSVWRTMSPEHRSNWARLLGHYKSITRGSRTVSRLRYCFSSFHW